MLVSVAVVRVGVIHGWRALLSLMDASLDPELEARVREMLLDLPGVRSVRHVRARRSGPFYFVEGSVLVARSMEVARSHELAEEAEKTVREALPRVERLLLHAEPYDSEETRVIVPVDDGGDPAEPATLRISAHFGRARSFAIAALEGEEAPRVHVVENPFRGRRVRAGLAAVNRFLAGESIDAVIVREIGEIAFHAIRESYGEVYRTEAGTVAEAVALHQAGKLERLMEPTHSSEERLDDHGSEAEA